MSSLFRRRFDELTESPLAGNPIDLEQSRDRLEPTSHTVSKRSSSAQPLSTEPSNSRRDRRRGSSKGKVSKSKNKLATRRSFVDAIGPSEPLSNPTLPTTTNPVSTNNSSLPVIVTYPSSNQPTLPGPSTNLPQIFVNDSAMVEVDNFLRFRVALQGKITQSVTVDYEIVGGSAIASQDYDPVAIVTGIDPVSKGTIRFNPSDRNIQEEFIFIRILPDQLVEGNESFSIQLSNPTNAVIEDNIGIATIQDDDHLSSEPRVSLIDTKSYATGSGVHRSASISADGRYVVYSRQYEASSTSDIFLLDRVTGNTRLISPQFNGRPSGFSENPSISNDGQFVVFRYWGGGESRINPSFQSGDLFIYNQTTQQLRKIPLDAPGAKYFKIAGDGKYVFIDTDRPRSIGASTAQTFLYNLETDVLEPINLNFALPRGGAYAQTYGLSQDARYVTYVGMSSSGQHDIFVYDRIEQKTNSLNFNIDPSGFSTEAVDNYSAYASYTTIIAHDPSSVFQDPFISADGRYVAFASRATSLTSGTPTPYWNIYLHDRETKTTSRITDGAPSIDYLSRITGSFNPVISDNNRFIAFGSYAANLVPSDTNWNADVFVYDRETQKTERVSVARDGTQANFDSGAAISISADGRFVAFNSTASNLRPYNLETIDFPRAFITGFNAYYVVDREAQ